MNLKYLKKKNVILFFKSKLLIFIYILPFMSFLNNINIKPISIILEPLGRNTAPAITVAALKAIEVEDDPHLLIMSSDHQILNPDKFLKTIEEGLLL